MTRIATTLLLATAATFASASGTSLNFIPIAEVIGNRLASRMVTISGEPGSPNYQAMGALFGLGDRAELGFDSGSDGSTIWNAKVNLFEGSTSALAIGVSDWERDTFSKYVVGRLDLNQLRFHGGYLHDGVDRPFVGLDFDAFGVTWMVDHVGGLDAKTWFGGYYEFNDEVSFSVGAAIPKGHEPSSGWYAMFTWTTGG